MVAIIYTEAGFDLSSSQKYIGKGLISSLKVRGLSPRLALLARFPVFLSNLNEVVWHVTLFIYECGVSSPSNSKKTIQTYTEHLVTWIRYLERIEVQIEDACEEDLLAYRNEMVSATSARTGGRLKTNTINDRTASVVRFYKWAGRKGHFRSKLSEFISTNGQFAYSDQNQSTSSRSPDGPGYRLRLRAIEPYPTIVRIEDFHRILDAATSNSEKVAYRLMISTGLRRSEICRLNIGSVPDVSGLDPDKNPLIDVELIRKGGKVGTVKLPFALAEELNWFILLERIPTYGASTPNLLREPLFVNKRKCRFQPDHFGANFKRAASRAGIKCTCHSLRHTYAICALKILQTQASRGAQINPLKVLQRLLGHAHAETTEIYLRALEANSAEVVKALDYLYGATLQNAISDMRDWSE